MGGANSANTIDGKRVDGSSLQKGDQVVEVSRYATMPQFSVSILDTFIPRYQRLTQLHFGAIVSNPHAPMAFSEKMGYNMTYNLVPPGNGNALHMHKSLEIFVALDGKWEIAWGMKGEHKVLLQPWDFVAVPARVCHSYKNAEEDTAHNIMTILPGKSWITWAPEVVGEARQNGAECDDNGMMLKFANRKSAESLEALASQNATVEWKHMGPDEMQPYVHSFADQTPLVTTMTHDNTGDGASTCEMFWKKVPGDGSFQLPRREGIDVLVTVLTGSVLVKTSSDGVVDMAGKLDCIRAPQQTLEKGEVILENPTKDDTVLLVTATHMRELNELYFHLC